MQNALVGLQQDECCSDGFMSRPASPNEQLTVMKDIEAMDSGQQDEPTEKDLRVGLGLRASL